jgi:streptogramin lyase
VVALLLVMSLVAGPIAAVGADAIGTVRIYKSGVQSPEQITAGPDGNLWFTSISNSTISRMTPAGAVTTFSGPGIVSPFDITAGPDGNVWFTNRGASSVGRITPSGVVTAFPVDPGPFGITAGPDGNLWFTTGISLANDPSIGRITPAGVVTMFPVPDSFASLFFITTGPDGNLWFTDRRGNQAVGRITPSGVITVFSSPSLSSPVGIAAGSDGNVWVANQGAGAISRVTPSGTITRVANLDLTVGGLYRITPGTDGNLWFSNTKPSKPYKASIWRLTPAGQYTRFCDPRPRLASGITSGPDGNVWFTNETVSSIGRIQVAPGPPRPTSGFRITTPEALPAATVGQPYSTTLTSAGGTAPYLWRRVGKLPKGLKLSASTGVLSGVPKERCSAAFAVKVRDGAKPKRQTTAWFALTVG